MQKVFSLMVLGVAVTLPVQAQPLFVAYPPDQHQTTSDRIFFIGTAPVQGEVSINGEKIARSPAGHFAPSLPLQLGENRFTLRYGNQELTRSITRLATAPELPTGLAFGKDSLAPLVDIARSPNELLCFSAIAPPQATVTVKLANQVIPLTPQAQVNLPANSAVLTQQNQPDSIVSSGLYRGCTRSVVLGDLGQPQYQLTLADKNLTQPAAGSIKILSPTQLEVAEVTAASGTARTGASTDYSRLTPLPKGTQASVTGYEGEWVRLDYGAWIKRSEVKISPATVPPTSLIRSIIAKPITGATEIAFPLQVPVPITMQQGDRSFTLTLHNTTAQTDTIKLNDDPLIARLDWQQVSPSQIQYTFNLKTAQHWGYQVRYEGTTLILTLRHPPTNQKTLAGVKVLLDPGHGGIGDLGAKGPNGLPEKTVTLAISKLVQAELVNRGATVYLTREQDVDVPLLDRVALIEKMQPTIALSLHYNALPDQGDALNTQGISAFWYHPQAHSLAVFLHNYLVEKLNRRSDGVYWNNLALTRPTIAPSVLLELGFMINPTEFEWIVNPNEQKRLAVAIADGIAAWLATR
jgi:N-acetylmuramoyl-L-alanine amidase